MLRICLLTTSFPRFEGDEASIFVQRLVAGYAENGVSGVVLVPRDASEPEESDCGSFQVRRFRYGIFRKGALAFGAGIMPNIRRRPGLLLQAPALLFQLFWQAFRRRNDFEVAHANWALALLAAWWLKTFTGRPYLVTVRGEDLRLLQSRYLRYLFLPALRAAGAIVSVNQQFVTQLQALGLRGVPCVVIPNGVSQFAVTRVQAEALLRDRPFAGRKYLLFVGTVVPRKRVAQLRPLLTCAPFREHGLVICGRLQDEKYLELLQAEARSLGVADRVFLEGAVAPERIGAYLAGAHLYCSASEFEGRPNSVLEAMAFGLPCVVSNIQAHREIIEHGKNGLICDFEDIQAAEKLLLSFSEESLSALGAAAKESLKEASWKACAQTYLNLFKQIAPADKA